MSKLIALVATAVLIDGQRHIVEPGQELPELSAHDEQELLANGSAMDPERQAATDKQRKQEEALAMRSFQEARERVQAERASTQTEPETSKQNASELETPETKGAEKAPKSNHKAKE